MLGQLLRGLGQRPESCRAQITSRPVGPGIPDPDDIDLHRSRASFCRDFRHHADPDAGGDHLADRIETVQPRAKAQARAEPRRVPADMGVQRDRADQADEIALHHFAEIDLPPVRQFVVARGDQHQAVFAERDPLDIVGQARVRRRARDRRRRSAMARAISELSRSSTSIEMWGCAARKAASAFGRYSERPDVLARKRTVAFAPRA